METALKEKLDQAIETAIEKVKKEKEAEAEKAKQKKELAKRSYIYAPPQVIRKRAEKEEFSWARLVKAIATGRWAEAPFEKEQVSKALSEGTDTAGGYIVPAEYSRNIIDLLYAQAVMRKAGASVYPMKRDTLEIPKLTTGATTYWSTSEGGSLTEDTTEAFGQVKLVAKKLYCLVAFSNELVADSDPAVESVVRRDVGKQLALAEDLAYLRGDGTGGSPLGIMNISGVNTVSGVTEANLTFDQILDLMNAVESDNAQPQGFIMHPYLKNVLRKLQDSNGRYIYAVNPADKVPDSLYGLPVYLSTQMNSGTDYYIVCGQFDEAVIGERKAIEIAASEHVNFKNDQTVLRAIMRVDFILRHPEAFAKITVDCS